MKVAAGVLALISFEEFKALFDRHFQGGTFVNIICELIYGPKQMATRFHYFVKLGRQ